MGNLKTLCIMLWHEFPHISGFVLGVLSMYVAMAGLVLVYRLILGVYPT